MKKNNALQEGWSMRFLSRIGSTLDSWIRFEQGGPDYMYSAEIIESVLLRIEPHRLQEEDAITCFAGNGSTHCDGDANLEKQ
jgi:hypothetical protein